MANDINVLEEIGLQEVSRKTHIELKYLEYMINKDFSKLKRTNALGYVKIINREYNIELKEWLEEFEAYWSENKPVVINDKQSNTSVFASQQQAEEDSSKGFVFLLLIVLLVVAFYFFGGLNAFENIKNKFFPTADETNTSYTATSVVAQTKEQLKNLDEQEKASKEDEMAYNEQNDSIMGVNQNLSQEGIGENENKSEQIVSTDEDNQSKEDVSLQANQDEKPQSTSLEQKANSTLSSDENLSSSGGVLIPLQKIWVGIINIDTKEKKNYLTANEIAIDLNAPQILMTGHGYFRLKDAEGKEEIFKTQDKKYYYIDGGTITRIDRKEFISYNGGKIW